MFKSLRKLIMDMDCWNILPKNMLGKASAIWSGNVIVMSQEGVEWVSKPFVSSTCNSVSINKDEF